GCEMLRVFLLASEVAVELMLDRQHRVERVQVRGPNRIERRPADRERLFIFRLIFFARWQLLHRPQIDNQSIQHLTKTYHKYALAQILIIFWIAFMTVALPRVSRIDCINDVALFIKSKAAVTTHVLLLSRCADLLGGSNITSSQHIVRTRARWTFSWLVLDRCQPPPSAGSACAGALAQAQPRWTVLREPGVQQAPPCLR